MIIFGIDAGTKSIGWAVIDTAKQAIIATGSRIFSGGRSPKNHETLATARRSARLQRRQIRRRKSRMKATLRLIHQHINADFDPSVRIKGQVIRPDEARARLLTESPDDFGGMDNYIKAAAIAIYNISGFRGFQSNLKTPPVYPARAETRGQEMYRLRKAGQRSRLAAPDPTAKASIKQAFYDSRPKRVHIMQEFNAIWDALALHNDLFTDELRQSFDDVMFFQRPVQDGNRGRCAYMPGEVRAWEHETDYQRFVIRKSLADIRYMLPNGETGALCDRGRVMDRIFDIAWEKGITWKAIEKEMRKTFGADTHLTNVEGQQAEGRKGVGPAVGETEDEEGNSTKRTGGVSLKAARLIFDRMAQDECNEFEAVQRLADERDDFERGVNLRDIPDGKEMLTIEETERLIGEVNDPSVRVIVGQMRIVMKELVRRFGLPDGVALESAREIGRGTNAYQDASKKEAARVKRVNNRIANEIRGSKSRAARLEEIYGPECFFCGAPGEDNEHLIPNSVMASSDIDNQVRSCHSCNHHIKGEKTPFDAFFGKPQWGHIMGRLRELKKSNKAQWAKIHWRFASDVMDRIEAGFHPRDLNSLRYAEKIIRTSIAPITKSPKIVRGKTTARGRRQYRISKNRDDHRHHARDAIIIALAPRDVRYDEFPTWITGAEIEAAVDKAVVSHRCDRSKVGALHNATAKKWREQKESHVVTGEGRHRKVFRPDGNWAMEVYAMPDGEWVGKTITLFAANQKGFRAGVTERPHPCAKVVMRIHRDDTIALTENGKTRLMRVKMLLRKTNGEKDTVSLVDVCASGPDARGNDYSAARLKKSHGRMVDISATGMVRYRSWN